MNPLGSRARAEELARLLEDSTAPAGTELASRLKALAPALAAQSAPRAEFRAALRTRLIAVAEVQGMQEQIGSAGTPSVVTSWSQTRKAQRRIGATAGVMAGIVAFAGVGTAATRSLPGAPFYSLKLRAEAVELRLTDGDQAKGSKHLEFADTRLREVEALAAGSDELVALAAPAPTTAGLALGGPLQDRINRTLQEFDEQTTSGRHLLEAAFRDSGKQEPLRILQSFATAQQGRFSTLLPSLPANSVAVAQRSLALVKQVESAATEQLALAICDGECFPSGRGPEVPVEPLPAPGATAVPTDPSDNDGGSGRPTEEPAPQPIDPPTTSPSPEPTSSTRPSPSASPSPTSSPTPSPTPSPTTSPRPQPLPVPLPTDLPTPIPLPSPLNSLLPVVVGIVEDALS